MARPKDPASKNNKPTKESDHSNQLYMGPGPDRRPKPHKPDGMWESSYRYEYCHRLVEHMSQGYSFYSFASEIGVVPNTLDKWLKKHEEFADARDMGEAHCLRFWEEQGLRGLSLGKNFNSIIWIFNMKNRFRRFGWRDKWAEDDGKGPQIHNTVNIGVKELGELVKLAREQQQEISKDPKTIEIERSDRTALASGFDRAVVLEEEPVGCLPAPQDPQEPVP